MILYDAEVLIMKNDKCITEQFFIWLFKVFDMFM